MEWISYIPNIPTRTLTAAMIEYDHHSAHPNLTARAGKRLASARRGACQIAVQITTSIYNTHAILRLQSFVALFLDLWTSRHVLSSE